MSTEAHRRTQPNAVFAVSSRGNVQALTMCLASVALQTRLPAKVLIRLEGEITGVSNFYMEQTTSLLRIMGAKVYLQIAQSRGVRAARAEMFDFAYSVDSTLLWMGDEDCVYAHDCFNELISCYTELLTNTSIPVGWIQGNKPDVNNRRGYVNFDTRFRNPAEETDDGGYNFFFNRPGRTLKCSTLDTGNVLFPLHIQNSGDFLHAGMFDESEYNSSGEDTLAALYLLSRGYEGFFRTSADSYHLEKPVGGFDEFSARKNYIAAVADKKGYDKSVLASVLPWVK